MIPSRTTGRLEANSLVLTSRIRPKGTVLAPNYFLKEAFLTGQSHMASFFAARFSYPARHGLRVGRYVLIGASVFLGSIFNLRSTEAMPIGCPRERPILSSTDCPRLIQSPGLHS